MRSNAAVRRDQGVPGDVPEGAAEGGPLMLVLVVEDDERVAQFLSRGLTEEGHTVDRCSTGEDAARQGLSQPYDIVLLDWALPDTDGICVLRAWRKAGFEAPVIMLTARSGVDATVLALDAGADDYLAKPFSFEELLARMRAHLRRSEQSGGLSSVAIGPMHVDLRERVISRAGGPDTDLSPTEFALLDLLLKRRGEVLSRDLILDVVWADSASPSANLVDVYVRHLRTKLDTPGAGSVIETVRGRGYRLRAEDEL